MFTGNLKSKGWLLLPIAFITTWPPLSMLILVVVFLVNILKHGLPRVQKLFFVSFICFFIILIMSFFSSLYNNESIFDAKNFKFFFYLIALTYGYSLAKVNFKSVFFILYFTFCTLLIIQYLLFGWSSDTRAGSAFYLPDQNNSMIIISFLFPAVLSGSNKTVKMFAMIMALICMYFIGSRAGFALVGAVLVFYILTKLKGVYRFSLALIASTFVIYNGFDVDSLSEILEFNSYSDQVRLTLWKVGLDNFFSHENLLFGMGYEFFGIYNHYLSNDMKHVHNIYLQVLFTTGILGCIAIIVFLFSWLFSSMKQGNTILLLQVVIVMLLGLVETVYSDSRVFVVICYFLGLSYRNFSRNSRAD